MSTIFEVIDSLRLPKEETNKLQSYLITHNQEREVLHSALTNSFKTDEDKLELLKEFLKTLPAGM
jgi:adenosine deaminase